jgi:hypothetical protein
MDHQRLPLRARTCTQAIKESDIVDVGVVGLGGASFARRRGEFAGAALFDDRARRRETHERAYMNIICKS